MILSRIKIQGDYSSRGGRDDLRLFVKTLRNTEFAIIFVFVYNRSFIFICFIQLENVFF